MPINDYIIYRDPTSQKPTLGKVEGKKKGLLSVWPNDNKVLGLEDRTKIPKSSILANLGPKPAFGRVYNISVEPHRFSVLSDWGEIRVFREMLGSHWITLNKALDTIYALLTRQGIPLTKLFPLIIELRNPLGYYAGSYKYNGSGCLDVLTLRPSSFSSDTNDMQLIAHEIGHGVWFRCVPPTWRADWVSLYHRLYTVSANTEKLAKKMLTGLLYHTSDISDFVSFLDEEEKLLFDAYIAYVKNTFSMSKHDLNLVLTTGRFHIGMWPKSTMELVDMETIMTEYSKKNPDEFFAEAFRLHLLPFNTLTFLPKKLMKRTLKNLS